MLELFDIPIYRCTIERHSQEMEIKKKNYMILPKIQDSKIYQEALKRRMISFEERCWYPWKYNEIIGWISVYLDESKVRGDLWFVRQRISRLLKKKRFLYRADIFEWPLFFWSDIHNMTSEQVFEDLKETILKFIKDHRVLKNSKYYIDFTCFNNVGRLIDWKSLLKYPPIS